MKTTQFSYRVSFTLPDLSYRSFGFNAKQDAVLRHYPKAKLSKTYPTALGALCLFAALFIGTGCAHTVVVPAKPLVPGGTVYYRSFDRWDGAFYPYTAMITREKAYSTIHSNCQGRYLIESEKDEPKVTGVYVDSEGQYRESTTKYHFIKYVCLYGGGRSFKSNARFSRGG